jgi:hypothetical protein
MFPMQALQYPVPQIPLFPVQFSLYGGVAFMKQTYPRTYSPQSMPAPTTAQFTGDLKTDYAKKILFGIEVPVSSIVSAIKSGIGGGGGGGGGGK